jgi:Tol biopolymer transport system component
MRPIRLALSLLLATALLSPVVGACGSDDQPASVTADSTGQPSTTTVPPPDSAPPDTAPPDTAAPVVSVEPAVDTFVFRSNRTADGSFEIFRIASDGTGLTQLTDGPGAALEPVWSHDGTRITFTASRWGAGDAIYTMNADGSDVRQLTDAEGSDRHPSWSPDGTRIVFVSERDDNRDLYVMDADGSNVARLTDHPEEDDDPDWGPDGQWIAFASNRQPTPTGVPHLWVMRPDGTGVRTVTGASGTCSLGEPATWSPDGTRLAFAYLCDTATEGSIEIRIATLDATGETVGVLSGITLPATPNGGPFSIDQSPHWTRG